MLKLKYLCIESILNNNLDYSKLNNDCKDRINDVIEFQGSNDNRIEKISNTLKNQDRELLNYIFINIDIGYINYFIFNYKTSDKEILNLILYLKDNYELNEHIKDDMYTILSYELIYRDNYDLIEEYISSVPNGKLKIFQKGLLLNNINGIDKISQYANLKSTLFLSKIKINDKLITDCFIYSILSYYRNKYNNIYQYNNNINKIIHFMLFYYYNYINFDLLLKNKYNKNIDNYIILLQKEYLKIPKPITLPNMIKID
jgi:hypothetical protein